MLLCLNHDLTVGKQNLLFEILKVRIKPLQEISEEDAKAEGISVLPPQDANHPSAWWQSSPGRHQARTPSASYAKLWDTINKTRGYSFASNPWVWIIEVKVI